MPAVVRGVALVRSHETEPRLGNLVQNAAKRLDDQVAPLVAVESADEEHLFGVTAFQMPSLGGWHWPSGVGDHFGFRQDEPIEVADPLQYVVRGGRDAIRDADGPPFLADPFAEVIVLRNSKRRTAEDPGTVQADADGDRGYLTDPSRPPKRLFHLDDLDPLLGDGTPNRR